MCRPATDAAAGGRGAGQGPHQLPHPASCLSRAFTPRPRALLVESTGTEIGADDPPLHQTQPGRFCPSPACAARRRSRRWLRRGRAAAASRTAGRSASASPRVGWAPQALPQPRPAPSPSGCQRGGAACGRRCTRFVSAVLVAHPRATLCRLPGCLPAPLASLHARTVSRSWPIRCRPQRPLASWLCRVQAPTRTLPPPAPLLPRPQSLTCLCRSAWRR